GNTIANGIISWNVGFVVFINSNKTTICGNTHVGKTDFLSIWGNSNCAQYNVTFYYFRSFLGFNVHFTTASRSIHFLYTTAKHNFNSIFLESTRKLFGNFLVFPWYYIVKKLHNSYFCTKSAVEIS